LKNKNQAAMAKQDSCVPAFTNKNNRPITLTLEESNTRESVTFDSLWQNYRRNLKAGPAVLDVTATLGGGGAVVYSQLAQKRALTTLDSGYSLSELEKMTKTNYLREFSQQHNELVKSLDNPQLNAVVRSNIQQALTDAFGTSDPKQVRTLLAASHNASTVAEASLKQAHDYVVEWAKLMKKDQLKPEQLNDFVEKFSADFKKNPSQLKVAQLTHKSLNAKTMVFSDEFVKFFESRFQGELASSIKLQEFIEIKDFFEKSSKQLSLPEGKAKDLFKITRHNSEYISDMYMVDVVKLFEARGNKFIDIIDDKYKEAFKAFVKLEAFLAKDGSVSHLADLNHFPGNSPKKSLELISTFSKNRGVPPSLVKNIDAVSHWVSVEAKYKKALSALGVSAKQLKAQAGKKLFKSKLTMAVGLALLTGVTTRQVMLALNHQANESSLHLGDDEVLAIADYDFGEELFSDSHTKARDSLTKVLTKLGTLLNTHSQLLDEDLQVAHYCKPEVVLSNNLKTEVTCRDL
ncbi:MAG: hypothetical protein OXC40_02550, partial [Proteobacteria bacterium]|nr:hypothetical protein [Pseudomonadota bacterium]